MKVRVKRIDVEGLRLQMGCSMEAMATYLGISKSAYSMMQGGRRTLPIKSQQRAEDLKT